MTVLRPRAGAKSGKPVIFGSPDRVVTMRRRWRVWPGRRRRDARSVHALADRGVRVRELPVPAGTSVPGVARPNGILESAVRLRARTDDQRRTFASVYSERHGSSRWTCRVCRRSSARTGSRGGPRAARRVRCGCRCLTRWSWGARGSWLAWAGCCSAIACAAASSSREPPGSAGRRSGMRGSRWLAGEGSACSRRDLPRASPSGHFAALIDLCDRVGRGALAGLPRPQRCALEVTLLRVETTGESLGLSAVSVAFVSLLRELAAESPLLIAIDDVQWLDALSAQALVQAARRLEHEPIGFLLARSGAAQSDRAAIARAAGCRANCPRPPEGRGPPQAASGPARAHASPAPPPSGR